MTGFIDPLADDAPYIPPPDDDTVERVRDLVLRAHPNIVPELVRGESIADLLASIEPATTAYSALAERIEASRPAPVQVPAGSVAPGPVDLDTLSSGEKLRRGLAATRNA